MLNHEMDRMVYEDDFFCMNNYIMVWTLCRMQKLMSLTLPLACCSDIIHLCLL